MEAFLLELLPRLLANRATFSIHAYQGKSDLLQKLDGRLRGYAKWLPSTMRIIVVVDRDSDDCHGLKQYMEVAAANAGLVSRTACQGAPWQVANRIAIEELEAWFFSEWTSVRKAYPRVRANIPSQGAFRQSDAVTGGTWQALERVLQHAGYFATGLRKTEAARLIGKEFDPVISSSPSFVAFRDAVLSALT